MKNLFFAVLGLAVLAFVTVACNNKQKTKAVSVQINAGDFVQASGDVEIKDDADGGKYISSIKAGGWLAYDVEVPVAGRYSCELSVSSTSSESPVCWVEDYINNEDGRTYNITAGMPVPNTGRETAFVPVVKYGSPLNAGPHQLKLHVEGEGVNVRWIKFTLMKKHQITPKMLTQSTDGKEWQLVWSDEFDGSGIPDTSKWTFDIGNWGWGNNEPQYYTENRLENARRENGRLIIEARKDDLGQEWTSARLTTRGKVSFLYGKIEFRAQVPAGDGSWAAGWFLGDAYRDEVSWPYCGEIDVLECVGREIDDESGDGTNHASCHTRAYYFKQGNQISSVIDVKNMSGEFHIYSIEWTEKGIKAFLDGQHYYTYDKLNGEWEWPFNNPQNIIVNLAMGGGMGGVINPDLTSQQFIIDYIRVYELK
ncbi:family 16 glycosylhydrolase [candidate division KSB1 bacterium]|nr:family 16 glycosylhydrolase [candidate division KSB1 bacterium]